MAVSLSQCIKAINKANGIVAIAADSLNITREALHKRIQRNQKLKDALNSARERNIDYAESKLLKQMNADYWPAIKYFLSTQGKKRGYTIKEIEETPQETEIVIVNEIVKINKDDEKD